MAIGPLSSNIAKVASWLLSLNCLVTFRFALIALSVTKSVRASMIFSRYPAGVVGRGFAMICDHIIPSLFQCSFMRLLERYWYPFP